MLEFRGSMPAVAPGELRRLTLVATALLLAAGSLLVAPDAWRSDAQLHTVLEAVACSCALFVGSVAMVRFYSRKRNEFLFIATGFLGSALLDGFGVVAASPLLHSYVSVDAQQLTMWTWFTSRLCLSSSLLLSYLGWVLQRHGGGQGRIPERWIYAAAAVLTIGSFLVLALAPLPPAYRAEGLSHRQLDWIPGALFLAALLGCLHKGQWRRDGFEYWLVLALIVFAAAQLGFMIRSDRPYDAAFDMAQLLKIVGCVLVIAGVLVSVYQVYRRAAVTAGDLKRANLVLANSLRERKRFDERFRLAVAASPSGMVLIDREGTIVLTNQQLETQFGYERNELVGSKIEILLPEPFRDQHIGYRQNYLSRPDRCRQITLREIFGVRRDGSQFPVETIVSPIVGEDEVFVLAAVHDVTVRKQAQRAQRESEEKFRQLAETIREVFWITSDAGDELEYVSPAFDEIWGRGADSSVPLREQWLAAVHPDDRDSVLQAIRAADGFDQEYRILRSDGEVRWIRDRGYPILGDGAPRLAGIAEDITNQKLFEASLKEKTRELARSNAELEQFAYVASHDLQEPLRKIASCCQVVLEDHGAQLDDDGRQWLDFAIDGARRMRSLIADLLAYSRAGRNGQPSVVDAERAYRTAVKNLASTIEESGALLEHEPLPRVLADELHVAQLLQNLIGNAVKYCDKSSPFVQVYAQRQGDYWRFCVRDNGIGIAPEYHGRIFDIFQRLHNREEYSGTGIGLSICKKIVERYGGSIWIESIPGEGSSFFFTLPVCETANEEEEQHELVGAAD